MTADVAEASHRHLTVDVVPDFSTFDVTEDRAFYVEGAIFRKGDRADRIGTFRCWGWLIGGTGGPGAAVSQAYEIDDRGEIQVQGLEDDERAVVGGTGDFRFARGEGVLTDHQPLDGFQIKFHLKGARR